MTTQEKGLVLASEAAISHDFGDVAKELVARIARLGQIANGLAARAVFEDHKKNLADSTTRRHRVALAAFGRFIARTAAEDGEEMTVSAKALGEHPVLWSGVTWGFVRNFRDWLGTQGYAPGTMNGYLCVVKLYAKLAGNAGALADTEARAIGSVEGLSQSDAAALDADRVKAGEKIRVGHKKGTVTRFTAAQRRELMAQPDTPQGRRDAVIMVILLDHGLRCGELASMEVDNIDLEARTFRFWREKTREWGQHEMTARSFEVLSRYMAADALTSGLLLRGSRKGKSGSGAVLTEKGMTARAIRKRVGVLGDRVGIERLAPHDCRHHLADRTIEADNTDTVIMDTFGWKGRAMIDRYRTRAKIGNAGLKLED